MKLSDIFASFGPRIASLKQQGKVAEARALILERDKALAGAPDSSPPTQTPTPSPKSMDYTAAINSLTSRVTALESEITALKAAGPPKQTEDPLPPPVAQGKLHAELAAITDPAKRTAFMQQHAAALMAEARRGA